MVKRAWVQIPFFPLIVIKIFKKVVDLFENVCYNIKCIKFCGDGEIGKRTGLKILRALGS